MNNPDIKTTPRITMVMAGDEEGGLEKHVVELSNGLADRGYIVTVIAHAKYEQRLSKDIQFLAVDLSQSRRNPLVLWQLYQAIKKSQPDVLHVHANKAASMVAPMLKWLKVPSVVTMHNKKSKVNLCAPFNRIIAVSRQVAAQFKQQDKVRVVLNGVTMPRVLNADSVQERSHQAVQALAVGRLVPVKGFDLLIDAWQGIDATLHIVGDGPDYQALTQQIQRLGLQDQIKLLGYRDDIPALLAQSDVFIISSRHEGGPYTLAEALLTRTPVLSTNVGMVAEVLPQVLICEADNVTALHELLTTYLSDMPILNKLTQPVYQFAQDHLSFDAMLDNTIAVYEELGLNVLKQGTPQ